MKIRSGKNKGYRLEKYLCEHFKKHIDPNTHRGVASRQDVILPRLNLAVEAKNEAVVHFLASWEQAVAASVDKTPVLAIRNPKKPEFEEVLVVLTLEHFTELLKSCRVKKK